MDLSNFDPGLFLSDDEVFDDVSEAEYGAISRIRRCGTLVDLDFFPVGPALFEEPKAKRTNPPPRPMLDVWPASVEAAEARERARLTDDAKELDMCQKAGLKLRRILDKAARGKILFSIAVLNLTGVIFSDNLPGALPQYVYFDFKDGRPSITEVRSVVRQIRSVASHY